jgi:hypothetical protein
VQTDAGEPPRAPAPSRGLLAHRRPFERDAHP